jgi:hypothetical protein
MAKQTFTTGQVLTAAQMTSLQQTALGGGSTTAKTASYVLLAADAGTVVQMNSASATTITVNTALFAAGDTVQIQNVGSGVCTVTAGSATVSTSATLALKQYDAGSLYFNTTSAAIFFAVDAADGMANPLTTTGDIIYSSSGTTAARLGIGSSAQVLTVASGIPSWATPASSGLTLIKRASTSGAANTGTTFDGVFTSTYTAYIVVIEKWTAATSTNAGLFQFRVGAVTRATSYYGGGVEINRDNTETYNGEVNTTSRTLVTNLGDTALPHTAITLNLTDMFQATVPSGYWTGIGGSTGFGTTSAISGSLIVDANTAFDGFLLSASSNIACTVSVYGLAK